MAIPPTIPTSFVPRQPVSTLSRRPKSGMNALLLIGMGIFVLSVIAAGAVFGYQKLLERSRDAKSAEIKKAQQEVNTDTVEGFIRLRNRLLSTQTLLDNHIALSRFLDVLETRTLQTVRFSTLQLTVKDDHSAEIQMDGVAKSFNALAAQSAAFASEKRIKRAIFAGITVNKDGTVGFKLTAELDPRLIVADSVRAGTAVVPASGQTAPIAPTAGTQPASKTTATSTATSTPVKQVATTTPKTL